MLDIVKLSKGIYEIAKDFTISPLININEIEENTKYLVKLDITQIINDMASYKNESSLTCVLNAGYLDYTGNTLIYKLNRLNEHKNIHIGETLIAIVKFHKYDYIISGYEDEETFPILLYNLKERNI